METLSIGMSDPHDPAILKIILSRGTIMVPDPSASDFRLRQLAGTACLRIGPDRCRAEVGNGLAAGTRSGSMIPMAIMLPRLSQPIPMTSSG